MQSTPIRILQRNENFFRNRNLGAGTSYAIELRKSWRRDSTFKKRKLLEQTEVPDNAQIIELFYQFQTALMGNGTEELIKSLLQTIRYIVSNSNLLTYEMLVECRIIHNIVDTLLSENLEIIEETTWILCNIASGNTQSVDLLISLGVIEKLISLFQSGSETIIENSIWCLSNIAGDSESSSESILKSSFLHSLSELFNCPHLSNDTIIVAAWALGNISQKCTNLPLDSTRSILSLTNLILSKNISCTVYDCLRTICGISDKSEDHIQELINCGLSAYTLSSLCHSSEEVHLSGVRALGSMLAGTTTQCQILINLGVIEKLQLRICSSSPAVRKEVHWALANIAAGSISQVAHLVDHPIMIIAIAGLLDHDPATRVQASWICRNIAIRGCSDSILKIMELGGLRYLKHGLEDYCREVVANCLVMASALIRHCEKTGGRLREEVGRSGVCDSFEKAYFKISGMGSGELAYLLDKEGVL